MGFLCFINYGADYVDGDRPDLVAGPADSLISYVVPAKVVIYFWCSKRGTPGEFALSLRIVDEHTGNALSVDQAIGQYFAYFAAMLPLFLGIVWVAFDEREQGRHDKLAKTVVVRAKSSAKRPVFFNRKD